jgi:hypothetical protein
MARQWIHPTPARESYLRRRLAFKELSMFRRRNAAVFFITFLIFSEEKKLSHNRVPRTEPFLDNHYT